MENREECRLPMFGRLRVHAFCWMILIVLVVATLLSCGSRTSEVNLNKASEKTKEQINSQGQVKKESGSQETKSSVQQNNTVDEKQEQRVREVFDENGKLKERITELLNSKKTDNSSKTKNSSKVRYVNTDSVFNNTVYRTKTVTQKVKEKKTDANNNSLYWTIGVLGFFAIVAVFMYFYIRKK